MKLNSCFSISVFAGLALAAALLWLLAGWQPKARAAETEVLPATQAQAAAILPTHFFTTTVDAGGDVGEYPSLKLNAAGNPVISYYDYTNTALKLAVCGDATCTSVISTTVDGGGEETIGWDPSLELNAAGNPVISYYDDTNEELKLAVCGDATCTSPVINTVDSTGDVGRYSSLELNAAGNPVISYHDSTNTALKLAVCEDATCTSVFSTTVDSDGYVGLAPSSLKLNSNGNPVIGYYDSTNSAVKVAVCGNATCSGVTPVTVAGDIQWSLSMALDAEDIPIFSYFDYTNFNLMVAVCEDASCSRAITTTVDSTGDVGRDNSLELDVDGNPVISYAEYHCSDFPYVDDGDLKIAVCKNKTCTSVISTTVDATENTGWETSLVLDAAGNPVISYYEATNDDLKIARMSTCFSEYTGDNTTDFSSPNMLAVQNAIDAAEPGSTVKVAGYCPGVQHLTGAYSQTIWLSKALTLQGGYTNTAWLDAPDPIANPTTLDAQGGGRVVHASANGATVSNLKIVNGQVNGEGAGIYVESGSELTVDTCSVTDNQAIGSGGGIHNLGALTIINSSISDNSASGGGGIFNDSGTLTVLNSTFSANRVNLNGGSISNLGTVTVNQTTFSGNSASASGGAIYNGGSISNLGTVTVNQTTFSGNSASASGGAIYNEGTLIVTSSTFSSNEVPDGEGGAMSNLSANSRLTLVNSTAYNNTAKWGGGLFNNGALTITNSTLSENSASEGGAGLHLNPGSSNYLRNTLIANSTTGPDCQNYGAFTIILVNDSNLIEDGTCSPQYSGDPNLGVFGLYDGVTHVLPLLTDSPAIDKGNDAVCSAAPVNGLDQRGMARPQGDHCDVGAFEWESFHHTQLAIYLPLVIR